MEIENQKVKSRNKFEAFSKRNGIQHWPKSEEFLVNPFIYEGEVIGIKIRLLEMISATNGIFQISSNDYLIVSNIPKGLFSKSSDILLAGRFIGKESIKLPIFGDVLIPHLKFIDAYICKNYNCDELLFWTK